MDSYIFPAFFCSAYQVRHLFSSASSSAMRAF